MDKLRVSFLCSDASHPVNRALDQWVEKHLDEYEIEVVRNVASLGGGDVLFMISCTEIVTAEYRARYRAALVLHASDLPLGRGWNPHIWRLLEGGDDIVVSLLEAEDRVDSGRIWKKMRVEIPRTALWDEINQRLFDAEFQLVDFALGHLESVQPEPQDPGIEPTYYPRRTPEDSRLDANASIASQFDQMRVCDPERFPAFVELHGMKFKLVLERLDDE